MKHSALTSVLLLAGLTGTSSAATWYFTPHRDFRASVNMTFSASVGDVFTVHAGLNPNHIRNPSTANLTGFSCGNINVTGSGASFWLDMDQGAISRLPANQQIDLYTNPTTPGYTSVQSVDGTATAMFELNNGTSGQYSWVYSDNSSGNYDLKLGGKIIYGKCGEYWPNYAPLLMKKSAIIQPGQYTFNVPVYHRITYDNNVGVSPVHMFGTVATTVTVNNTCNAAVGSLVYAFDKTNLTVPQSKSTSLSVTCDDPDTQLKFRIMAGDGSATQTASNGAVVMTPADGLSGTMQVSVEHASSTTINSSQWSSDITASTVNGLTSVMSIEPDVKAGTYNQTYQIQVAYD